MGTEIKTPEDYRANFQGVHQRKLALYHALDIRKFEIELYWKRATYFWTLLAATFAGYFALSVATNKSPLLIFLVSCLGLVLASGWYLVNRGSKYWQSNWERHVDALENEFIGPLYKTTISKEEFRWINLWDGYRYSVSKINQLISLFIFLIWFGIFLTSFLQHILPFPISCCLQLSLDKFGPWILFFGTLVFVLLLLTDGRSGPQESPRPVHFVISDLAPSD